MFSRRAATVLLLSAPVVLSAATPGWAEAVGLDVWNVPALQDEVENEARRGKDLGARGADILRRIEVKEVLVEHLISGRTTLAEVTAQFLAMNRGQPNYMEVLRNTYPAGSDEATTARAVLGFVAPRLAEEPLARRAEVTVRLEAEFARLDAAE